MRNLPNRNRHLYDAARDRFIDSGENFVAEWPEGSGQMIWGRYDDEKARSNGFADYGVDGALDAYFACVLAIKNV